MIRFASVHALYIEQEDAAKSELGRAERARHECLVFREQLRLQQAAAAIATADQAVEQARIQLAEAHRRRATIAKLRERDRQAEILRDERREQRRSDDRAALKGH